MKILFDHTIFIHQKIGGISKYIVKLNENLNKKKNISKIFCPISINFNLKNTYTEKYNLFNISKIPLFSKKLIFFINNFLTLIYFYIYRPNFIHLSYYNNL